MVIWLVGAPFGVVNAIQYSTDGCNLSFITVGWFEIHSCVALLPALIFLFTAVELTHGVVKSFFDICIWSFFESFYVYNND